MLAILSASGRFATEVDMVAGGGLAPLFVDLALPARPSRPTQQANTRITSSTRLFSPVGITLFPFKDKPYG